MTKQYIMFLAFAFIFLGAVYDEGIFLALGFIFIFLVLLSKLWVSMASSKIHLEITSNVKASFRHTPFEITYTLVNRSFFPITNSNLQVDLDQHIIVENSPITSEEGILRRYLLNFSLPPRSKVSQTLTCKIGKRGLYYFGDTSIGITDPFHIFIEKKVAFLDSHITIYPEITGVPTFKERFVSPLGNKRSKQHLFEDKILPKGAREYSIGDPLSSIDWKQTSKLNKLYTKQYEHTSKQEIWILGNLKSSDFSVMGVSEKKIEMVISTIASLSYLFSKRDIPYHIILNAKLAKINTLYKLYANTKKDLNKILLELSRLKAYITVDYRHTFKVIKDNVGSQLPMIILVSTYLSDETRKQIQQLRSQRFQVIWVDPSQTMGKEDEDETVDSLDRDVV